MAKTTKTGKKTVDPVVRDATIHMHKYIHKIQFKRRAPRAIR
eukprot:CAMPEP_0206446164 /NCGR_PEP_ID=MMETSP0324_2-20121206/15964_1 /ASSEMBLY_ACC=CAM_ASM_000836 /TAXON_ID=2866 /ORGANISM="Crypthecodinium cohnii, Strain Seligo" /LENGTH=41 /DNA_ID= /DNA_START= /DNA_END= /DNA_ORIENTATION=